MQKEKSSVRFIRKNGRIIPIRSRGAKKPKKSKKGDLATKSIKRESNAKTAAKFGIGAALSSMGGAFFGTFTQAANNSRTQRNRIIKQIQNLERNKKGIDPRLFKRMRGNLGDAAFMNNVRSKKFRRFGTTSGVVLASLGSALIENSLQNSFEKAKGRRTTDSEDIGFDLVGAATGGGLFLSSQIAANRIKKARNLKTTKSALKLTKKILFKGRF